MKDDTRKHELSIRGWIAVDSDESEEAGFYFEQPYIDQNGIYDVPDDYKYTFLFLGYNIKENIKSGECKKYDMIISKTWKKGSRYIIIPDGDGLGMSCKMMGRSEQLDHCSFRNLPEFFRKNLKGKGSYFIIFKEVE